MRIVGAGLRLTLLHSPRIMPIVVYADSGLAGVMRGNTHGIDCRFGGKLSENRR